MWSIVILDALFTPFYVQAAINIVFLRNLFHARSVSLSWPGFKGLVVVGN